jgi:hypothetical protein
MRGVFGPTLADTVWATLSDNPESTSQEIAAKCGLRPLRVGKVITDLVAQGRATCGTKRPCRVTGRWMTPWRLLR